MSTESTTQESTMRAAVVYEPGSPSVLKLTTVPIPISKPGFVLIRIKAAGLNRSEMFTRQGHSGTSVKFPRILGIEAAGEVAADTEDGFFKVGDKVVTAMGGMGRTWDGGYAEYTLAPIQQVQKVSTGLSWDILGALPEMCQTAWGSLFTALRLEKDDSLLVRGGTTSVGLAAIALAKAHGAYVAATSRKQEATELLLSYGADEVIVDSGEIVSKVREKRPQGFSKCLELIGTTTLNDSIACTGFHGVTCMTGIVGNAWHLNEWNPMENIPSGQYLTCYSGGVEDFMKTPLQEICDLVEEGKLPIKVARTFELDDIVKAHELMESNAAGGKIVILL